MVSRYENRRVAYNNSEQYSKMLENRGTRVIRQFTTPQLLYPSAEDISTLTRIPHIWRQGDHYFKLAHEFYKNPAYWWVIAFYNKTPIESDINFGDIVYIPVPLERMLEFFGV